MGDVTEGGVPPSSYLIADMDHTMAAGVPSLPCHSLPAWAVGWSHGTHNHIQHTRVHACLPGWSVSRSGDDQG